MLEVKNIYKKIKTDKKDVVILNDISFKFSNNGLYGIFGESGAGKTTFLNIIEGIDKNFSGDLFFNNKKYKNYEEVKNDFSICFQSNTLLSDFNVLENLKLECDLYGIDYKNIEDLLEKFDLLYLKNKKINELSGGEIQRICIIRSLLKKPKVIFLDEPTGSVDSKNAGLIFDYLKEISKEVLVIVVSHDIESLKKYSNFLLEIKKNKLSIIEYKYITPCKSDNSSKKIRTKFKDIIKKFSKEHLKKFTTQNTGLFISFLVICIIFSCLISSYLSFEYINKNLHLYFFNTNYYTISKKVENQNYDALSLIKYERPLKNEVDLILNNNDFITDISFDYYFNYTKIFINDIEFNELITFEPYEGNEKVYYCSNQLFNKIKTHEISLKINLELPYSLDGETLYNNINIIENNVKFNLIDELSLVDSYKIYYPYYYYKNLFSSYKINGNNQKEINLYKYILDSANDSIESSYKLVLFSDNFNLINKDVYSKTFDIVNNCKTSWESYYSLASTIIYFVSIFLIIALFGVFFLYSYLFFIRILSNRRNVAILKILGCDNRTIFKIFISDILLILGISLLLGLIIGWIIFYMFNTFFEISSILNQALYFSGIYGSFLILFFLAIYCLLIFYKAYLKKINIKEELNSI